MAEHLDRLISEQSIKIIDESHLRPALKKNIDISQIKWPKLGSLSFLRPMIDESKNSQINKLLEKPNITLDSSNANRTSSITSDLKVNDFQLELYSLLSSYKDLLYTDESIDNLDDIQQVYLLHILNHLMLAREKIISNNKIFEKKTKLSENLSLVHDDPKLRDQGYTRAKILFLLPFRYSALRLGKSLVNLLGDNFDKPNYDKFVKEFGDEDGVDSTLRPYATDTNKPNDYFQTFHGNTDDSFRVGLKLTKKSLKFFSDFYDSDIIIASPLGLKTIITPDENRANKAAAPQKATSGKGLGDEETIPVGGDKDFLSSIEIIVLDQADVFLMQNWEHVLDVIQHINLMPHKPRKMDISRVRLWHLENWSKYYRQLVVFSSVSVPLVHSFFQSYSLNYEGYLTFKHRINNPQAMLVSSKCKQRFMYYDSPSARDSCDDRFNYFIKQVLPKFTRPANDEENVDSVALSADHTLIMVSSYFDYVRLRNYFRREKLSFTQICEYTEENKVAKARQLFYFGARQFLIYTERCHFYHRYKIKGIRNIIFYEPPIYSKFYTEMANMLTPELQGKKFVEDSQQFVATTLFSNHDTLQLGAIIGYSNAVKLIQNKKSIT